MNVKVVLACLVRVMLCLSVVVYYNPDWKLQVHSFNMTMPYALDKFVNKYVQIVCNSATYSCCFLGKGYTDLNMMKYLDSVFFIGILFFML
jgi:hypothetical protein